MKILMVLTSHDKMGDTGHKTGFWLEEFTAPYYVFADAGCDITLASPAGGQPPVDPNSDAEDAQTDTTRRFKEDASAQDKLRHTVVLDSVRAADYDAIFYPGGHGPLWDLTQNADSIRLIQEFLLQDKPVGAVCHAPAVLLKTQYPDGTPVLEGIKVTGFTNSEEEAVGLTQVVPFLLEDELKKRGGNYQRTGDFKPFYVRDGWVITGQNPASSETTARALLRALRGETEDEDD